MQLRGNRRTLAAAAVALVVAVVVVKQHVVEMVKEVQVRYLHAPLRHGANHQVADVVPSAVV